MPQPEPLSLKRDQQGRIAERTIRLGDYVETRRYAYDAAGRLSRVTDGAGALRESYAYDPQGRRLAEINPARFRGERRSTYLPGNRLGQAGSAQFGHDRAGFRNLKVERTPQGDAETHYHYEPSGLLMHVDLPDGRKIQYVYDTCTTRTACASRSGSIGSSWLPSAGWTRCGSRNFTTGSCGGAWPIWKAGRLWA